MTAWVGERGHTPATVNQEEFLNFALPSDERISLINRLQGLLVEEVISCSEELKKLNPTRKHAILRELQGLTSTDSSNLDFRQSQSDLNHFLCAESGSPEAEGMLTFAHRVATYFILKGFVLECWRRQGFFQDALTVELITDPARHLTNILFDSQGKHNLIREKYRWLLPAQNNYSWFSLVDNKRMIVSDFIFQQWSKLGQNKDASLLEQSLQGIEEILSCYLSRIPFKEKNILSVDLFKGIWNYVLFGNLSSPSEVRGLSPLQRRMGTKVIPKIVFNPFSSTGNWIDSLLIHMSTYAGALPEWITQGLFGTEPNLFLRAFSETKILCALAPYLHPERKHLPGDIDLPLASTILPTEPLSLVDGQEINDIFSSLPLEGHLSSLFQMLKVLNKIDYCLLPLPDHYEPIHREDLQRISPLWNRLSREGIRPIDWLYFFAISKLREGGLAVALSNSFWLTEKELGSLRLFLLNNTKILQIIDFGETPLIPRYLYIIQKCSVAEQREINKIILVKKRGQGVSNLEDLVELWQLLRSVNSPGDSVIRNNFDISYSNLCQGELNEDPWVIFNDKTIAPLNQLNQVPSRLRDYLQFQDDKHLDSSLTPLLVPKRALKWSCRLFQEREKNGDNFWILLPKPEIKESPLYFLSLLNSKIVRFWMGAASSKLQGLRIFFREQIENIPIHPISWNSGENPVREEKISSIKNALQNEDHKFVEACLQLELKCGRKETFHDAIEAISQQMIEYGQKVEKYSPLFREKWEDLIQMSSVNLPKPKFAALSNIIPEARKKNLDRHSQCVLAQVKEPFCLASFRPYERDGAGEGYLTLVSHQNTLATIHGPLPLIEILEHQMKDHLGHYLEEITNHLLLPQNVEEIMLLQEEIHLKVSNLLLKMERLQRLLDHLFIQLYQIEPSLLDQIFTE